jgi:N-formylglutamate amidohydrolase
MDAAVLGENAIRKSEDAFVDSLLRGAVNIGVPLIAATYARAYIDLNRGPYELDQGMFEDQLPSYVVRSPRVAAGLGSIARVVAEGEEIYKKKLFFSNAKARIEHVHLPYHEALKGLIASAVTSVGLAILIDWHSMPSGSWRYGKGAGPDVVLGDRFGSSCDPVVTEKVEAAFQRRGYVVARNAPFAGGFTTESYGRPQEGVHALQVELNRGIYLNEETLKPSAGFDRLRRDIDGIARDLLTLQWGGILKKS